MVVDGSYPRLLVVTWEALNDESGTGVSFGSLMAGWPSDRIAQVYGSPGAPNPKLCARSWKMSLDEVPIVAQLRRMRPRAPSAGADGVPHGLGTQGSARELLLPWLDLIPFTLSASFLAWVDEFRPEVVFSNLGTIRWTRLVRLLAQRHGVPVVPYFNDDWPTTHYARSRATWAPRSRLLAEMSRVLRLSSVGMAGSPLMAEEYSTRFALPFHPFMHCVDTADSFPRVNPSRAKLRFSYVGGLHLNRWKSLAAVARALANAGTGVELLIHAPERELEHYAQALAAPGVRLGGSLATREVAPALIDSDILVFVESFDDDTRKYCRLSLSTKIPLYLAAGRPVLAYGPGEVSAIRYLAQSGAAVVVDEQTALDAAVKALVDDAGLRLRLGENGWNAARSLHSATTQRELFRRIVQRATS